MRLKWSHCRALWPYIASGNSNLVHTGLRLSLSLSPDMQVRKTLSPLKLKKMNFLIKKQEINRDGKGNEKLCGKELHLNDICFNAHSLFSQLQKPKVMK